MAFQSVPHTGLATHAGLPAAFRRALLVATLTTLTACTNMSHRTAEVAPPAPAVVSMEEWMNRGESALKEGDHAKARDAWRAAAKDYPTAKQPWLKLSEDFFNAADYGNAVLAAQEALQRDPRDRMANSVLAVSGLRLTAGSLAALREDGAYPVGSRNEALSVTRSLREALGEPLLAAQPDAASKVKRQAKAPVRPAVPAASASSANVAVATPVTGSPLNKLK